MEEEAAGKWRYQILHLSSQRRYCGCHRTGSYCPLGWWSCDFWWCLLLHSTLLSLKGNVTSYETVHLHLLWGNKGNQWSSTGVYWSTFLAARISLLDVASFVKLCRLWCWLAEPHCRWESCACLSLSFNVLSGSLRLAMHSLLSGDQGSPIMIMATKSGECYLKNMPATDPASGLCFRTIIFLWLTQFLLKLATSPPQSRQTDNHCWNLYFYFFRSLKILSSKRVIIINLWGLRYNTDIGFLSLGTVTSEIPATYTTTSQAVLFEFGRCRAECKVCINLEWSFDLNSYMSWMYTSMSSEKVCLYDLPPSEEPYVLLTRLLNKVINTHGKFQSLEDMFKRCDTPSF